MSSIIQGNTLFVALSGIGNLLMQLPTIEALKKAHPETHITLWVAPRGTKIVAEACPFIDQVIEGKTKRSLLGHIHFAYRLSRLHPQTSIMLSPGQLIKGAIYMVCSGAENRIAHRYPHLGNPQSTFLLTHSIPEEAGVHDIEQNLRLLELVGVNPQEYLNQPYHFNVPDKYLQEAQDILHGWSLPPDKKLIGIHAGSSPDFLWKRWPLERFAHVARALVANHNAHILIFGGPDEKKQSKHLHKMIGAPHSTVIATNLLTAAGLMKHCHLFLANDSGLMHLAAAVNVRTLGIFGPTDESQTGPRGTSSWVIRAPHTKPLYDTERNYNLGEEPHETLLLITPEMVLETVIKHL